MDRSAIFLILRIAVVTAGTVYLVRQVKKPSRFVGRLFTRMMNSSHSALTDWALTHIAIGNDAKILDVGCGGGRTIEKLAAKANLVCGIDYAVGSVAASQAHNKRLIAEGKVRVERASVSRLPFPDGFFDVVTAIETQYYWPDLANDMRQILRVLKPGGCLMIVAESYKGGRHDWLLGTLMKLLGSNRLGIDDQRALFQSAGYTELELIEQRDEGWLCVLGRKPVVQEAPTLGDRILRAK